MPSLLQVGSSRDSSPARGPPDASTASDDVEEAIKEALGAGDEDPSTPFSADDGEGDGPVKVKKQAAVKDKVREATEVEAAGNAKGKTGVEACEKNNLDRDECAAIGCCHWDRGSCWSSVKKRLCFPADRKEGKKSKATVHKRKETDDKAADEEEKRKKAEEKEEGKEDEVVIVRERDADSTTVQEAYAEPGELGADWSDGTVDIADAGCNGRPDCADIVSPVSAEPAQFAPAKSCKPLCKWECESTPCEGNCRPECEQPKCETRCSSVSTKGCVMECDQPQCCTVCPKKACAGAGGCPLCVTNCSKPMCRLRCPQGQDCKSICEEPKCKWHCAEPSACPVPKCRLACEEPSCLVGGGRRPIPALRRGELKVSTFVAPPSFIQVAAVDEPDGRGASELASPTVPVLVETLSEDSQPNARTVTIPVLVRDDPRHTSEQ